MITIGLTGGIGSGKSTVAALLAEHGAYVIDADGLARDVLEPGTPGLAAVAEAFGPDVLTEGGELDRPALAQVVFHDEAARQRLNGIVHPLVRQAFADAVAAAPPGAVIVHDVPLLVETNLAPAYDIVLIVMAMEITRIERLDARGMTAMDVMARMAAQATDDERRAVADVLIDNDGTREELAAKVAAFWAEHVVPRQT